MKNLDDYFKQPTQEEVDKAWLRQLCYDGQMDDDEIDEFVEAVYQWKEQCVKQAGINTLLCEPALECAVDGGTLKSEGEVKGVSAGKHDCTKYAKINCNCKGYCAYEESLAGRDSGPAAFY
jgi:hypothetical protein